MLSVVKNESVAPATALETVIGAVTSWAGVTAEPGVMPGGVEIRHRLRVLGHIYPVPGGAPAADMIFSPAIGDAIVAQGRARRNAMVPLPGWIAVTLGTEAEVSNAIALFRENYERGDRRLQLL